MPKKWSEVAASGEFQALSAVQQDEARRQYFDAVVAPRVPEPDRDVAWQQFDADSRVAKVDLPEGVQPSAGRGFTQADPRRLDTSALRDERIREMDEATEAFDGPELALARAPKPATGAQGMPGVMERQLDRTIPEPAVPPRADILDPPRPQARTGGLPRRNAAADLGADTGRAGAIPRVVGKMAAGAAEGGYGALRAGAEAVGATGVAEFAKHSAAAARDFDAGMGKPQPLADFNPRGPMPYLQEMAEGAATSLGQSATYALAFGPRAVIPLLSLQSAGQQYQEARERGLSPGAALANAIPHGAFEAIGEKFQGLDKAAKALNVIAGGRATREQLRSAGQVLIDAGVREIPGELVTYLGQTAVDVLPGIGIRQDLTTRQFLEGLRDTVVQSAMMGTTMGSGGALARLRAREPRELTAEEIARNKGFLAQQERIKQVSAQGEKEVAGVLQRRLDAEQAEAELGALADKPYGSDPDFQQRYRAMRATGVKPAEASARAAQQSAFVQLASQAGLTPKAIQTVIGQTEKMPLDEVPAFLERFTGNITQNGMGRPLPAGTVEGAVAAIGDDAMNTAVDNIARLLGVDQADGKVTSSQPAAAVSPHTAPAPSVPTVPGSDETGTGNDVLATPEAEAAHQAATSPLNDLPEPTEAQKAAGNYKVGRLRIAGMDISIENPQGSVRRGVDPDGRPWETPMRDHYGYVRGTTAADGDKLDVFVKPGTPEDYAGPVFVVDQIDPRTGKFDEHKVVIGAATPDEAEALYRRNYSADWQGLGALTQLPMPAFQAWAQSNRTKRPLGDITQAPAAPAAAPQQPPAGAAPAAPAPGADRAGAPAEGAAAGAGALGAPGDGAGAQPAAPVETPDADAQRREHAQVEKRRQERAGRLRKAAFDKNPLMAFLGKHGLSLDLAREFAPGPRERRSALVPGYGPVFRRAGLNIDVLAQRASEEGFLPPGSQDARALYDMIARAFGGETIRPLYAEGAADEEIQRRMAEREEPPPTPEEEAAIEALSDLQDNELDAVEDLLDDIPEIDAQGNASTEDAMRALGFTDEEIRNATAEKPDRQEETGARGGDAGEAARAEAQGADRGRKGSPPAEEVARRATPAETNAAADRPEGVPRHDMPVKAPGERWTTDRGAMPGEAFAFLDGDAETGKAAMYEVQPEGTDTSYFEVRGKGGVVLARADTPAEAGQLAEQRLDAQQERLPETAAVEKRRAKPQTPTKQRAKGGAIGDFGEKLEGAAKDRARTLRDEVKDDEWVSEPFGKLWPADEHEQYEDPFVAALAFAARAEVPAKPRVAWKVRSWVAKVKSLRDIGARAVAAELTREELVQRMQRFSGLQQFAHKVQLLEQLPRDQWKRIGRVEFYPDAYAYLEGGKKEPRPYGTVEVDGKRWKYEGADFDGLVQRALANVDTLVAPEQKMKFEIRGDRSGYFVMKTGDREYRRLKEFKELPEARAYMRDHYDDLVAAWEGVKDRDNVKEKDLRRAENRPRTGRDWRAGKDATPEQFQETFGFRGGQFGNWVTQGAGAKERQGLLNQAFDALMDLSFLLNIPPRAISLNGTLGIAFGARGHGWASAHFEPDTLVVNLTKTRGAGALGHEWFHALDNYFARMRNDGQERRPPPGTLNFADAYREQNFITYRPERMMVGKGPGMGSARLSLKELVRRREQNPGAGYFAADRWQPDPNHPDGVRPEVEQRWAEVVNALNDSPMAARSRLIDKDSSGYWSQIIERGARSFENYLLAKMAAQGFQNDYLANVVSPEEFKRDQGRYPYLLPAEVPPIAQAMDNLFGSLQTKETERGLALFEPEATFNTGRSRPRSTITFATPITGPSGAKLTAYTWQWKPMDIVDARGEDRTVRISDWERSETNAETGRDVVHQFVVDGKVVSLESAARLLGYDSITTAAPLKSAASAVKTLARLRMQHAEVQAALQAYQADEREVARLPLPPVTLQERKASTGRTGWWWTMGDDEVLGQWGERPQGEIPAERLRTLTSGWRSNRLAAHGWRGGSIAGDSLRRQAADLEERIKRAEKKVGVASTSQDLLGEAPNKSQQDAARVRGEREERAQQQRGAAPAPEGFTLTGSDRAVDEAEARGQGSLFEPGTPYRLDGSNAAAAKLIAAYRRKFGKEPSGMSLPEFKAFAKDRRVAGEKLGADLLALANESAEGLLLPIKSNPNTMVALHRDPRREGAWRTTTFIRDTMEPSGHMEFSTPAEAAWTFSTMADGVAAEPTSDYAGDRYETDLFGDPIPRQQSLPDTGSAGPRRARPEQPQVRRDAQPAAAVQREQPSDAVGDAAQDAPGDFYVDTYVSAPVKRTLGASRIKTPGDLAAATSYLYRSAVERFDAIVTDKDGKPLAVVGDFKGALSQTSVYPATVMAEAIRVPGAAHIWFSHNHPSGTAQLSVADQNLNVVLATVFKGSGIKPMGLIAVGRGKFGYHSEGHEEFPRESGLTHPIPESTGKTEVPVYERSQRDDREKPRMIQSPTDAKQAAKDFYSQAKVPGMLLLDAQHGITGWVPLDGLLRGRLRGTGGLQALYKAASRSNVAAVVFVHAGELDVKSSELGGQDPAMNIGAALRGIDVRTLDMINVNKPGAAGGIESRAEKGMDQVGHTAYARDASGKGASIEQVRKHVDRLTRGWKNGPRISVVASVADLPAGKGMFADVRGLYTPGHVWVVAGAHEDGKDLRRSVARTLAHEAVAHFGLRQLLGREDWNRFMRRINLAIEAGNKPLTEIQAYVRKAYKDSDLSAAQEADEIAARAVEMAIDEDGNFKPGFGFFKEVWAKVAQFLRDLGIDVAFTNAELQGMLVAAMRNLETGNKAGAGARVVLAAAREDGPMHHRAFHGTPHDFDRFSTEKIGTGEGNQTYGWGLYFAENKDVAETYQRTLAEMAGTVDGDRVNERNPAHLAAYYLYEHKGDKAAAVADAESVLRAPYLYPDGAAAVHAEAKRLLENGGQIGQYKPGKGLLYEVHIPDEVVSRMLLWDKPLSEQPDSVRQALASQPELAKFVPPAPKKGGSNPFSEVELAPMTGAELYERVGKSLGSKEAASAALGSAGIPGIRYLDQGSRNRPLKEVKREFLAQLPEDADFDEVMDLIGDGTFSAKNEAVLKALAENDWLGFDYPAQAISAALGGQLQNYDASPALLKAVADAQVDGTYNLVVFNDKDVKVTHKNGEPVTKAERDDFLESAMARSDRPVDMPDAIIGHKPGAAQAHPDYAAAKAGDREAALRLAQDLVSDDLVDRVRDAIGSARPTVIGVAAEEAAGRNKIPLMVAEVLAHRLGLATSTDIVQANRAQRGGADGLDRVFKEVDFEGKVAGDYVIVDDTLTQGGTLADLASHIQEGGGRVVATVALTGKGYSAKIRLDPTLLKQLREKFGDLEDDFRAARGHGFDALTESEARYLVRHKQPDTVRARIVAQRDAARQRLGQDAADQEGVDDFDGSAQARGDRQDITDTPAFKRWFGDSKVVDAKGKPLVVYHGTGTDFSEFKTEGLARPGYGDGAHFSELPGVANYYAQQWKDGERGTGDRIMPVYLSIQNPFTGDFYRWGGERGLGNAVAITQALKAEGYDGIRYNHPDMDLNAKTPKAGYAWVAFRPEQIKSAIGNRGTFDPFDANILHARGTAAGQQQAAAAPAAPKRLSRWRDATGRVQFAPGQVIYDLIGKAAEPLLGALQLKAASPAVRRALREMKNGVRKAQETAAAVAGESNKLTPAERAMVSDIIEKELAAGVVPPQHAVRLAALVNGVMGQQTDELVRLGMLEKDTADRWRDQYLPRFYESKLTKKAADAWADALRRITGRARVMRGIGGKHLRGRGLYETIPESELPAWEAQGWEVRDPDYTPGLPTMDGTVQVWRDFTRAERDKMGEIRDVGFRFVMGYMQTQRDIALGRMFEALAADPTVSSRTATEKFSVQVPTTTVPGTGAKTYGRLAGRWVSKDTLSHLSAIEEAQSEALQMYRKGLALWKEGKTALNPVSHMNNVLSNLTMAHFAGVSYWEGHKYLAAAHDLATKDALVTEAKDAGLFGGTLSEVELMNMLPPELAKLARTQEGAATKVGRTAFNLMTFFLRRPMGAAYQAEDSFFRYLLYRDARKRGLKPADAVDYAQRFIFAYDDLPKGARRVRDFAIPFFSYTYKAAPVLLHTALTHPLRFAAPAAVLWAANAAAYAIAAGDDDEDWQESLRKYLTDPEFRAKAREQEQLEREHLPPWMKGTTALLTPKALRLGMDEVTKLPLFIDMARVIPGGDLFDVSPNAGGLPLPQPLTPSNPLFTAAVAMIGNKDLFFGKPIVDSNDTTAEAVQKRGDWIWKQFAPAIALGGYHWERGMNALAQATGEPVRWLPESIAPNAEATGMGRDGLPVQPKLAAMQTFGIKVRPLDLDRSEAIDENMRKKMIRDIDAELRSLKRLHGLGAVSDRALDRAEDLAATKKERLREGLTVDGGERR